MWDTVESMVKAGLTARLRSHKLCTIKLNPFYSMLNTLILHDINKQIDLALILVAVMSPTRRVVGLTARSLTARFSENFLETVLMRL